MGICIQSEDLLLAFIILRLQPRKRWLFSWQKMRGPKFLIFYKGGFRKLCKPSTSSPVYTSVSNRPFARWCHFTTTTRILQGFSFFYKLLVFSVTPFKIDQNKNQSRSIDKVQNLGNERTYIFKDPGQHSGQRIISYTRYPKKCFTQTYRDLYGDAMLVLTWMSSNMAWRTETNRNICYQVLLQERQFILRENS